MIGRLCSYTTNNPEQLQSRPKPWKMKENMSTEGKTEEQHLFLSKKARKGKKYCFWCR
jgi:hypothetical protein